MKKLYCSILCGYYHPWAFYTCERQLHSPEKQWKHHTFFLIFRESLYSQNRQIWWASCGENGSFSDPLRLFHNALGPVILGVILSKDMLNLPGVLSKDNNSLIAVYGYLLTHINTCIYLCRFLGSSSVFSWEHIVNRTCTVPSKVSCNTSTLL